MWYSGILIHTPIAGCNRKIFVICTHLACHFAHYTNQRQHLAYSQFGGVYIINNSCERYGGFMCALCSHSTVYLFIGASPFCIYSISHCCILPFFVDEQKHSTFFLHEKTRFDRLIIMTPSVFSRMVDDMNKNKNGVSRRRCFPLCTYNIAHFFYLPFPVDEYVSSDFIIAPCDRKKNRGVLFFYVRTAFGAGRPKKDRKLSSRYLL